MSKIKCPPQSYASGAHTPFDDLVGLQLTTGGGLTQGNFEFTHSLSEKTTRTFNIGVFSEGMSMEEISGTFDLKGEVASLYGVYPSIDLSEVTNFTLYGSLEKRFEASVANILKYFPAGIEILSLRSDFTTGTTAYDITYDAVNNETTLKVDITSVRNPFNLDFTENSTINLQSREGGFNPLSNMTVEYGKYSLVMDGSEHEVLDMTPSQSLFTGELQFIVAGNPFKGQPYTTEDILIRPNPYYVELSFIEHLDELERFLLTKDTNGNYTAKFNVPKEGNDGKVRTRTENLTWKRKTLWNLEIGVNFLNAYVSKLKAIASEFDQYKTNLISRFYTTDSLKEFDSPEQKFEKVLQIYGRSFDETKKFIDGLAYMNSVHYTPTNDIPSKLLKNLSTTLGWNVGVAPISEEDFISSIFQSDVKYDDPFVLSTPSEINHQFYRNLIINSAHMFKSKGTRGGIESILRMIGAPESLIEFNETIYLADGPIRMEDFNGKLLQMSGGTYSTLDTLVNSATTISIMGLDYPTFSSTTSVVSIGNSPPVYPIDADGYPSMPPESEDFFFQKGFGWYTTTPEHRGSDVVDPTGSVFTGSAASIKVEMRPQTYGAEYLDRYRDFQYMNIGFDLERKVDNKKSWADDNGLRKGPANYLVDDERLVINTKNTEIFLNPAQGILYDIWKSSSEYDYPIPQSGLTIKYPSYGGNDWTTIDPQPKKYSFLEFAGIFWSDMINARNRLYITDGKTGGYPTLESLFWKYIDTNNTMCIPFDDFSYQKLIDYVNKIGDHWVRLLEQMVPATTIWETGVRYENSIFHRQKVVYRRQMGCQIIPVPCEPCIMDSPISSSCVHMRYECKVNGLNDNLPTFFNESLERFFSINGLSFSDCQMNSLVSDWSFQLKLGGNTLLDEVFYSGYGTNDIPTNEMLLLGLNTTLPGLIESGYVGYLSEEGITVRTLFCAMGEPMQMQLMIRINFRINCN